MKIIFFLMAILMLPLVFAGNENGKITAGEYLLITDLDVTVDGRTHRNLEYQEDIDRIAKPSSVIKIKFEVTNNHTSLDMTEVEMIVTIEELDLEKLIDEFTLGNLKDKKTTVEFTLPSDTNEEDYEIFIEVEGELNNTLHRVQFIVDLDVEDPEEETTSSSTSCPPSQLGNLTSMIKELNEDVGSYFEPYTTCVTERKGFEDDVKSRDETIKTLQADVGEYTRCDADRIRYAKDAEILRLNVSSCYYEISNVHVPALKKTKQNYMLTGVGIILLVGALWKNKERLWKPKTEAEEEDSEA